MERRVTNFNYPVVYPNGAIEWINSEEEQQAKQSQIKEFMKGTSNENG